MKSLSPAPKNRRTPTRVIFGVGNSVMHQIVVEAEATTILSSSIAVCIDNNDNRLNTSAMKSV
ncbi:hypothetical protein BLOT_005857 [Blomia tropicalis]|nr:hypothetical protein BLOT_005857 [Blomia tropicalis]